MYHIISIRAKGVVDIDACVSDLQGQGAISRPNAYEVGQVKVANTQCDYDIVVRYELPEPGGRQLMDNILHAVINFHAHDGMDVTAIIDHKVVFKDNVLC